LKIVIKHILILAFLLVCQHLQAQDNYDKALDKYEVLCDRLIKLRGQGTIDSSTYSALVKEFKEIRVTLAGAQGKMSEVQMQRYKTIRHKYIDAMNGKDPLNLPEADIDIFYEGTPEISSIIERESTPPIKIPEKPNHISVLASIGVKPGFGAMISYTTPRLGCYIQARSNFKGANTAYECNSDGTTSEGYFWTGGEARNSIFLITIGANYRLWKSLYAYAGTGYLSNNLVWKDSNGDWAKVQDKSISGMHANLGLMYSFHKLTAGAGLTYGGKSYIEPEILVGIRF